MISEKENKRISKFLSFVLRHQPGIIGITLDKHGWTDVETLIEKSNENGVHFDRIILNHIVETNAKKRFSFNESNEKIRASQGHSVEIELAYIAQKPPAILYHGTGQKSVTSIKLTGLEKRERHHVHLSIDIETAIAVGGRHGKPFVFEVLAEQMYVDKYEFFLSENGVWLTDNVPIIYLREYK
ncbi:RNA 2'-phosphotransferase [Chitinophaga sp. MM2321]|uniref:RNA 2'-phosphotransferase n=1 Tax=Chitinophaga sp. MM2321 TaxID=3137178 RepID=UPI0032D59EAD